MSQAPSRRDAILESVAFAAGRFLEADDWTEGIGEVLARLGEAAEASRVYIFKSGVDPDGAHTTSQIYEWCAPGIHPEIDNPVMQNQRWGDAGLGRWLEVMSAGAIIQGLIREFPQAERDFLEPQGIFSIIIVPILVNKQWWGNIGFDDCVRERSWTSAESDALRIAASTLGAAIARRETERSRRQAEDLYKTLVEQIPAVVYINEPTHEYRALYTSPAVEEIFGVTASAYREEFLWEKMIHPQDRERVVDEDARTDETLEPFRIEYRMVRPDGRIVWVRDEAEIVRDERGDPKFWSGVMFDITSLKLAEQELEHALDLEREATARLRALDEMKNTFLQAVSHDLRTPLATVLGSAVMLDSPDVQLSDEDSRDLVHRIAVNAQKLSRLITDLLDLDRLSSGALEPKREPVDLARLVARVVAESEVLIGRSIQTEVSRFVVELDAPKVERIIENLLVNAARHTPKEAGIWVIVEPSDGGALIRVDDEGPGIPVEMRDSIFDAFERGPTPSAHAPGSGIGLTLVARFAELHGGRAWVEERPGGGSSFRVSLPGDAQS